VSHHCSFITANYLVYKMVIVGGEWIVSKVKGGLNQYSMGPPAVRVYLLDDCMVYSCRLKLCVCIASSS
jgi:hypothetical protein